MAGPDACAERGCRCAKKEAALQEQHLSPVTIQQHFDTFLHTYVPTRGRKGEVQEDNLDSPLVELELLIKAGERELDTGGRREAIYAFRREEKPDITPELFTYCVADFWHATPSPRRNASFQDDREWSRQPGPDLQAARRRHSSSFGNARPRHMGALTFSDAANLQQLRRTS